MKDSYNAFIEFVEEELNKQSKFSFFVRGIEFQEEAQIQIKKTIDKIIEIKSEYKKIKNEQKTNELLSYQLFTEALLSEINMVIQLKKDNIELAWNYLVDAQGSSEASLRIGFKKGEMIINYLKRLQIIEKIFFPPQLFVSMGFVVEKSRCSICNTDYGECDHIRGLAYMGEICCEIFEKMYRIDEVSIVENPLDKRCRALSINDNGIDRDIFTWRQINK